MSVRSKSRPRAASAPAGASPAPRGARLDPLSPDDYHRVLEATKTIHFRHGADDLAPGVRADYRLVLEFLAATGSHVSVLARAAAEIATTGSHVVRGPDEG